MTVPPSRRRACYTLITPYRRNRESGGGADHGGRPGPGFRAYLLPPPCRGRVCPYMGGACYIVNYQMDLNKKNTSARPACGVGRTGLDARVGPPATGCQIPLPIRCRPCFKTANSAAGRRGSIRFILLIYNIFPTLGGHFAGTQTRFFPCRQGKSSGAVTIINGVRECAFLR